MFSGIMSTVAMCREQQRIKEKVQSPTRLMNCKQCKEEVGPPVRFVRRPHAHSEESKIDSKSNNPKSNNPKSDNPKSNNPKSNNPKSNNPSNAWQEYSTALLYKFYKVKKSTHRDHTLLSRNREDCVVAPWPPSRWVDEEMDLLIRNWDRRHLSEHDVQIDGAEDLLKGVEGEPTQFALDEVGAVLHDRLQLDVPVPALPPGDEVEHVGALRCLAVLPAGVAGEGDAERGEEREVGGLVPHPEKPSEEVDLACDSGDGQEAGGPHDEEGEYCLVGEVGVDVGGLAGELERNKCKN